MKYAPILITKNRYVVLFRKDTKELYKAYIGHNNLNNSLLYFYMVLAIAGFNILNTYLKRIVNDYFTFTLCSSFTILIISYIVGGYACEKIEHLRVTPIYNTIDNLYYDVRKRFIKLLFINIIFLSCFLLIFYVSINNKDLRLIFINWLSLMALVLLYRASFLIDTYKYLKWNKLN